jgi:hypothetical protein
LPPGKGGGEGVAHGRTGQGGLRHRLTEASGLPFAAGPTLGVIDDSITIGSFDALTGPIICLES